MINFCKLHFHFEPCLCHSYSYSYSNSIYYLYSSNLHTNLPLLNCSHTQTDSLKRFVSSWTVYTSCLFPLRRQSRVWPGWPSSHGFSGCGKRVPFVTSLRPTPIRNLHRGCIAFPGCWIVWWRNPSSRLSRLCFQIWTFNWPCFGRDPANQAW